jgi:hypothetical protein
MNGRNPLQLNHVQKLVNDKEGAAVGGVSSVAASEWPIRGINKPSTKYIKTSGHAMTEIAAQGSHVSIGGGPPR